MTSSLACSPGWLYSETPFLRKLARIDADVYPDAIVASVASTPSTFTIWCDRVDFYDSIYGGILKSWLSPATGCPRSRTFADQPLSARKCAVVPQEVS
jgi:hypothetical protein